MVAIHTPITKGTVYTPVTKTCRVATDRGMIPTQHNWVRINDISSLHPYGTFRRAAMDAAKRFVADMERQGFSLITPEADMLVYGPIRHRDFSAPGVGAPTWRPAPGMSPTFRASGYDVFEDHNDDAEDFLLRAEFLSKRVHMVEYIKKDPV
jgi:hypothetical protein